MFFKLKSIFFSPYMADGSLYSSRADGRLFS